MTKNAEQNFDKIDNYSSFGLQWNTYRTTQLDSYIGIPLSKERLTRISGGSLEVFKGKRVLEVGCGAGRFTEVMLEAGAQVFATDISTAVKANYQNCLHYQSHSVFQANLLNLPLRSELFDIVVCIGVIQHTPSPEDTIKALCRHIKPGGFLLIDHYTYGYPTTYVRRLLRAYLLKKSPEFSMRFVQKMTAILWSFHKILWKMRGSRIMRGVRNRIFLRFSPIVDYHDAYLELEEKLLYEWAILDTHDTLTDYYKHLRSAEEIKNHLQKCGMVDSETVYAGNGVEARAKKPLQ